MNCKLLIFSVLEAFYVYYMYNNFKTTVYFHHPLELSIQNGNISDYFKHPISNDLYESKICPFGNLVGKLLAFWIIIRLFLSIDLVKKINKYVWILVFIGSLLMSMNSFIYLIPIFIYELLL